MSEHPQVDSDGPEATPIEPSPKNQEDEECLKYKDLVDQRNVKLQVKALT